MRRERSRVGRHRQRVVRPGSVEAGNGDTVGILPLARAGEGGVESAALGMAPLDGQDTSIRTAERP